MYALRSVFFVYFTKISQFPAAMHDTLDEHALTCNSKQNQVAANCGNA